MTAAADVLACLSLAVGLSATAAVPLPFAGYEAGARADLRRWSAPLADAAARCCQSLRATGAGLALYLSLEEGASLCPIRTRPRPLLCVPSARPVSLLGSRTAQPAAATPLTATTSTTTWGMTMPDLTDAERRILGHLLTRMDDLTEIADAYAYASNQTASGNNDSDARHDFDQRMQDLAAELARVALDPSPEDIWAERNRRVATLHKGGAAA